jgi:hypothetical protein
MQHNVRTHCPFALSVAAPAAKSKSLRMAETLAFDSAALRSGRTEEPQQYVQECTNLLWSDLELIVVLL